MRPVVPLVISVLIIVAIAPAAQAETYTQGTDDPAGDQNTQCAPSTALPATTNPCDILRFDAGHDEDNLYLKIQLAATTWPNAAQGVHLRALFTDPAGKQWLTGVILDGAGGGSKSTFGTDAHPAGVTWAVDGGTNTVRGVVPLASMGGIEDGALISIDNIVTRMGSRQAGQYLTSFMDSMTGLMPLQLALAAQGEGPARIFEDLNRTSLEHVFDNATSDDYVLNFTTDLTSAVASFAVNGTGMVNATLIDANGTELFNGTASTMSMELGHVTAGAWQLVLDYTDFNGTFAFALTAPADTTTGGGSTGGNGATGGSDGAGGAEGPGDGNTTGNETVDGSGDAGKESPGLALPMLSLGLVAVAFLARRRT